MNYFYQLAQFQEAIFVFYDNFKKLCEANNEKPTPVAQKLGCTSSNVALWKKGSVPRPAVLQKIADYFGVSTQYLLFGDAENKNQPATEGDRLNPDYMKLNAANRAAIDAAIAALLKSQQSDG